MNLVRELKTYMKLKNYTYQEVAERFGYAHKSTISYWFSRGRIPQHKEKDVKKMVGRK